MEGIGKFHLHLPDDGGARDTAWPASRGDSPILVEGLDGKIPHSRAVRMPDLEPWVVRRVQELSKDK